MARLFWIALMLGILALGTGTGFADGDGGDGERAPQPPVESTHAV